MSLDSWKAPNIKMTLCQILLGGKLDKYPTLQRKKNQNEFLKQIRTYLFLLITEDLSLSVGATLSNLALGADPSLSQLFHYV